jgi:MFS family permease
MVALLSLATVFAFPAMVVMLPLYARHVLGLGSDRMGLLMGTAAIGSFTGALGLMAVRPAMRRKLLYALVSGVTLGMIGLSVAQSFGVAALSLIVLALSVSTMVGLANTVVQERAPADLRGRISAIAGLSFFGLLPFASLGITSVADGIGIRPTLALGAGVFAVLALLVLGRGQGEVIRRDAAPAR